MVNNVLVPVKQVLIPFFGSHILAVLLPDGRIAASLSSLCKMLTLAKHGQMERIRRNKDLAEHLLVILVETPKGPRLLDALVAEAIRPWVMGIQINLIASEKRQLISALKEQAYEMLSRALLKPETEQSTQPTPEPQAVPLPQPVPRVSSGVSDSPWNRLLEAQQVSQEALRDIRREAEQQAHTQRALGGRMVVVEEWLMSLDRRVAAVGQGSAAEAGQQPTLSTVHQADLRTLFRLLEETTGRAQAQLAQELLGTFRVAAIDTIPDEQWPDVLAWCWWRARSL